MNIFISGFGLGVSVSSFLVGIGSSAVEHKIGYSVVSGLFLIASAIASRQKEPRS